MPSTKDASLYGEPRPKKSHSKEVSSSSTLAFTSQLSSLIASSSKDSSKTMSGRARKGNKDDIFKAHNKNAKKRALKDLQDSEMSRPAASTEPLDEAQWKRARRKMEEKSRLYNAMKRGDIEDLDDKHMVDFDRKWAEAQDKPEDQAPEISSDEDEESDEELIEYQDEFGRTRKGTRAAIAREEMAKRTNARIQEEQLGTKPTAPSNIIYGDTIQTAAFNPDESVASKMAELAAKRDKEPTPPPDKHFDSKEEIRTRGTGFYAFSGDKEERERQMNALKKEREETERARSEMSQRKEQRKREVEERRKAINAKRLKGEADRFLAELEVPKNLGGG
ncbi:hypothetical protein EJ05DRAFT_264402 [Pseudovirgaria hyperparasitica]|uniref:Uncharacterized protein n=1 Tax=Pseudovirgaria hyperparasitica TaxID=470096 RepID=A0A6A6WH76_9PEZI|nr:uncharacterized protein EJ05DRAFT_264402 [Pseudovirgaria hyperparasitica]KAF2761445.1 hypothetical protein EJ05DRAFT_264402 [Pseudovirgaria hyperparasitica]